ncbi:hypothetical protein [Flavobacterium sp.]|uniref:hypothetical protein n=1 Tax=Flavobacterium sp. TaxID=239 RepID=UPI00286E301B|nr:hypothetical protein [Flavobacterium sp.]
MTGKLVSLRACHLDKGFVTSSDFGAILTNNSESSSPKWYREVFKNASRYHF